MTATSQKYDENTDIWPQIELFIDRAIKSKKSGYKEGKVDAFGNPIE